jgi:hypothetical protein
VRDRQFAKALFGVLAVGLSYWSHRKRHRLQDPEETAPSLSDVGIETTLRVLRDNLTLLARALPGDTVTRSDTNLVPLPLLGWDVLRVRTPRRLLRTSAFLELRNASYLAVTINKHIAERDAYCSQVHRQSDRHRQLTVYDSILYQESLTLERVLRPIALRQ